ncbi:hypothetical protein MFFC18_01260 [Mariniblastus fucicola]|uniref:Uncharacterized protein n=1 Tax=Mariniblastus fucicola TaxID=980251 RepID=A0A5B9P464_9BACT|nr:hypothetical protein MFFC18_01260 [Mariniblastus fucicola]
MEMRFSQARDNLVGCTTYSCNNTKLEHFDIFVESVVLASFATESEDDFKFCSKQRRGSIFCIAGNDVMYMAKSNMTIWLVKMASKYSWMVL